MNQFLRRSADRANITAIGAALRLLSLPPALRYARERLEHAGMILMFHHVAPKRANRLGVNTGLEVTPETLEGVLTSMKAQNYDIISMDEVPERLVRARSDQRRFAALTFDDGGRDNLIHAAPILQRHGAPFTIYVTTSFASGLIAPWWYVIERATMAASSLMIDDGHEPRRFDTADHRRKAQAADALRDIMWRANEPLRARQTADLARQAGLDLCALTRDLYMDWTELSEIAALPGCTIGAHTATHANLARLDDKSAMREIVEARDIIRERLKVEVNHFSYPYGAVGCCDTREYEFARQAGFATAVTTRRGVLASYDFDGLACLPRVPINGHYQHPQMIDALVSGLPMVLGARTSALLAHIKRSLRVPGKPNNHPRRLWEKRT